MTAATARRPSLRQCLAVAAAFRGDGSVGSHEREAGIRNRAALWRRADRGVRYPPHPGYDDPHALHLWTQAFHLACQQQIDTVVARCHRLAGLRLYRATRRTR